MKVAELERSIEEKTQEKFNVGMKRNVLEERKRQIEKELRKWVKPESGEFDELRQKSKNPPCLKILEKRC